MSKQVRFQELRESIALLVDNQIKWRERRKSLMLLSPEEKKTVAYFEEAGNLQYYKHLTGDDIRVHLLTLGFLRGIPYKRIENNRPLCNKEHSNGYIVRWLATCIARWASIYSTSILGSDITEWLNAPGDSNEEAICD